MKVVEFYPREFRPISLATNCLQILSIESTLMTYVHEKGIEENFEIFSGRRDPVRMRTMNAGFIVIPYKNFFPLLFLRFYIPQFSHKSFYLNSSKVFPMIHLYVENVIFKVPKWKFFLKNCIISDIISRVHVFIHNFYLLYILYDKNKNAKIIWIIYFSNLIKY